MCWDCSRTYSTPPSRRMVSSYRGWRVSRVATRTHRLGAYIWLSTRQLRALRRSPILLSRCDGSLGNRAPKPMRTIHALRCERCGIDFVNIDKRRRFHSRTCANGRQAMNRGISRGPNVKLPRAPYVCETCGGRTRRGFPPCPACGGEGLHYPDQLLRMKVEQVKAQRPPEMISLEDYRRGRAS